MDLYHPTIVNNFKSQQRKIIFKTRVLGAHVTITGRAFGNFRISDCDICNLSMPQRLKTGRLNCTSGACFPSGFYRTSDDERVCQPSAGRNSWT